MMLIKPLSIRYYRRTVWLMGSPFEITVCEDNALSKKGVDLAFCEIARLERLLSVFRPDSEVSRINRIAKQGTIEAGPTVLDILSLAIHYARLTNGAVDPTIGPLIALWQKGNPKTEEICAARRSVGYEHLVMDKIANRLTLLCDGMALNFGAIGKGYAIDRAVSVLKEHGITRALVSCRSTIYGLGRPPFSSGWPVSLQHPRQRDNQVGTFALCDRAIATSGDYERSYDYQEISVCHVIDPRTGWPTKGVASATVVSDTATAADALSTALLVQGESGLHRLPFLDNSEGYLVLEENEKSVKIEAFPVSALTRRSFLAACASLFVSLLLPRFSFATVVYATKEEALQRMMPNADRFETQAIHLTEDQLLRAQEIAKKEFQERDYTFWLGKKEETIVGYATVLEVIGKSRPITFLIGIAPDGTVRGMEVLVYRESEGSQVRHERFMRQFQNKGRADPLTLGNDIQAISGATLSSRAAVYAAKKALALFLGIYIP